MILQARNELDAAMALHKQEEQICRELGNKQGLCVSLGNQAVILQARNELDAAMALLKQQEQISRALGVKDDLQISLGNQAVILQVRGDLDAAMALFKQQEGICRELGNVSGLANSLAKQAFLLANEMGRPQQAVPLAERAYRLATDHGLTALARQIKPILNAVRQADRGLRRCGCLILLVLLTLAGLIVWWKL